MPRRVSAAALSLAFASTACDEAPSEGASSTLRPIARQRFAAIDAGRPLLDTAAIRPLAPVRRLALDGTAAYSLSNPVSISAAGAPVCRVAVGDRIDRAVHLFAHDGAYRSTVFGGGRDTTAFPNLRSVALDTTGALAVSDMGRGTLHLFAPDGSRRGTRVLARLKGDFSLGSQLVWGPDGRLLEHWFSYELPIISKDWDERLPLVRILSPEGGAVGGLGTVRREPGQTFTAALNRGIIARRADTLWYARRADGRLLAFDLARPGAEPVRAVDIPVFYHMSAPQEGQVPGPAGYEVAVQEHVRAFAIAPSGHFLIGQSRWFPEAAPGTLFRPRTALTVLDPSGRHVGAYDLGGEIVSLAASDRWIYAILIDPEEGTRVASVYPNPVAAPSAAGAPCGGGAGPG
ncbi:MAG TPA: hypothetical protein VEQ60_08435 [Longimicrobium sp.]|nr:hypothetical protein [Longimicrobium sp.]